MHMPASTNRTLRVVLWCALIIGIAITALGVRQVDLWWQLPEGLSILHDGRLPVAPPAAFGLPHQPYVDEYSLYEITLALLDRVGGFGAIWLAFVATYLLNFAIPLATARGMRRDWISLTCLALAGIFMVNRYEQRPEIVGALLLVLLLRLIGAGTLSASDRDSGRLPSAVRRPEVDGYPLRQTPEFSPSFLLHMALLFAVWTNVHSSYVVGFLALFLWLLERVFLSTGASRWNFRQGTITLGTACAAVLVNPYGWQRVAFTFGQEHDLGSNLLSREMWPAWDQPLPAQALLLVSAIVLAAACVPRNRPAPWLIVFACAMLALSVHSIRHISFLAVALLFIGATRPTNSSSPKHDGLARTALLGAACIGALLFDFVALRNAGHAIAANPARNDAAFAPALVEQLRMRGPAAVLCHDAEGSYLSFAGGGALRPLIDSGQGRFDDASKRFYFFLEQDPRAFDLALQKLDIDDVLITRPMAAWVLALANQPAWHLAAWNDDGMLFARGPVPSALNWSERDQLRQLHDEAQRLHDPVWAFCFSTLVDDPENSLALLDRSRRVIWSETFLNFFCRWLDRVPESELDLFLKDHPGTGNSILRELILMRARPQGSLPVAGPSQVEQLVRIMDLLQRGDLPAARETFTALSRPMASTLYHDLRDRLNPAGAQTDIAAEKWQNWNAGGVELFQQLAPLLNQRIAAPGVTAK
jgi:hypothetical protein